MADYAADIKKYTPNVNLETVASIVKFWGESHCAEKIRNGFPRLMRLR
jgi:hypothetical protein